MGSAQKQPDALGVRNLLARIASLLVATLGADIPDAISHVLELVGTYLKTDYVLLLTAGHDTNGLTLFSEWSSAVPSPLNEIDTAFDGENQFYSYFRSQTAGLLSFPLGSVEHLPEEARSERLLLRQLGAESCVVTPLMADEALSGYLFAASCAQKEWSDDNVLFVEAIGSLLSSALARYSSETASGRYQRLLETTLGSLRDGIFIIDRDTGRIIDSNPAATHLFDGSAAELCGLQIGTFIADPPTERKDPELSTGSMYVESIMLTLHGVQFPGEYCVVPIDMTENDHSLSLFVVRDLTRRKQQERELQAGEERLRAAQKAQLVGQLAGGLAHDFNNILTVISGYSELLHLQMATSVTVSSTTESIIRATQRGARLTQRLLGFSRSHKRDIKALMVNDFVEDMEKMVRRIVGEKIQIRFSPFADHLRVFADGFEIEQVLLNLVMNARDAMPDGGEIILQTELRETQGGEYVAIDVSDTGTGMSREIEQHVFEPFFTTKEGNAGTGLGLYTSLDIVRSYGGNIVVRTVPGCGSTFSILLPPMHEDAEPFAPGDKPKQVPASRGAERILLVEDDNELRKLTTRLLESQGYLVYAAESGEDAVSMVASVEAPPDLLLTDLVLPHMSGSKLAEILRSMFEGLSVLCMSGYATQLLPADSRTCGQVLLLKPFVPSELFRSVRRALEVTQRELPER